MKKYLTVLICCVAIGIGLNVQIKYIHDQPKKISIALTNIEALARGETGNGNCRFFGSVDCPYSGDKVLYVE
ncbi:NVEALA domain-containing protein [Sphingobacterium gobiense]|uniref:NVEALA family protein n=1 Tax=Sphingobacterium gobiense TaxID=1382456 RepID=A0A2S9JU32_9SPHI|nr:NVEALA domain-containing protein [Sphingobacterium gobiense]PRD56769.1 hypothetical protein C5749_05950 [Sphingobacterium gobiense]